MVRLLSDFLQRWSTWSYIKKIVNDKTITQTAFADDMCILQIFEMQYIHE